MEIKNIFYNIITSDIKTDNLGDRYKVILLNSFLLFGALSMGFTLIYRVLHPVSYAYIIIDFITSSSFVLLLILLRKYKNVKVTSMVSSIIIIVFMLIFIYINKNKSLGVVWTYTVPIYVILLNGYKKGGILVGFFYIMSIFLYIIDSQTWTENSNWDNLSIIRYTITSIILVAICLAYDYIFYILNQNLRWQSYTDALTGISNRRSIDEALLKEIEKQRRNFSNLSFAILDIDDFKMINDEFGHLVGDKVLKELAAVSKSAIRVSDLIGRWGGEEFCVISADTSISEAVVLFERLRVIVNQHDFMIGKQISCSIGVSCLGKDFDFESLIRNADKMLYKAKHSGKNQVCFE